MDFDAYKKLDAVNFSSLKHILKSPAHYKAALATEVEETIDMRLGTAVHEWILEGKVRPYVVRPENDPEKPGEPWHGARKSCKAWLAERKAEGVNVYTQEEESRLLRMVKALSENSLVKQVLAGCQEREKVVTATLHGLEMKARLDMAGMNDGRRLIVDLKKTPDASPKGWGKKCYNMDYDMQLALYSGLLGVQEELGEPPMVLHVVVEDSDASPVMIYSVPQAMWDSGNAKLERACALLLQCRERNEWPAYANGITEPVWPKYAEYEEAGLLQLQREEGA